MDCHPSAVASLIALKQVLSLREAPFEVLLVLLDHLAEDAVPFPNSTAFLADLERVPNQDALVAAVEKGLEAIQQEGGDGLMTFMNDIRRLVGSRGQEDTIIDKRSPAGLFIRRTWLAFHRLPYHGVLTLLGDLRRWCGLDVEGSMMDNGERKHTIQGTWETLTWGNEAAKDEELELLPTRYNAYDQYERALKAGEHIVAHDSLRRFFDYRFGQSTAVGKPSEGARPSQPKPKERILHQQALLNLANLYLEEGGYEEARQAVEEAARIARQVMDRDCLSACKSILIRLDHVDPPAVYDYLEPDKLPSSALPPQSNPTATDSRHRTAADELWDLERGLHSGVPLHYLIGGSMTTPLGNLLRCKFAGHREMIAAGRGEMIGGRITWNKAAWHAMAAELYELAVHPLLVELHQALAIEANAIGGVRLAVQIARADKLARAGTYNDAVKLLLDDATTLEGSPIKLVAEWQRAVYSIYRLRAERGAFHLVLEQIGRVDPTPYEDEEVVWTSVNTSRPSWAMDHRMEASIKSAPRYAQRQLRQARKLLKARDLVNALKPILETLSRTEPSETGQGLVSLHLRAQALLAEWLVEAGEPAKAIARLDNSDNLEQLAKDVADAQLWAEIKHTRGRAIFASILEGEGAETRDLKLKEAAQALQEAADSADAGGCWDLRRRILSDLAICWHEIGDLARREEAAFTWQQMLVGRREAERELLQELSLAQDFMANTCAEVALVLQ